MKRPKKRKNGRHKSELTLRLTGYGDYISEVRRLETMLAAKPRRLHLEMIGVGEVPPDAALLMRSIILGRTARTQLVTTARSSLQGAAVLIWLLGDTRHIREDARLYVRPAGPYLQDERPGTGWRDRSFFHEDVLEADDYIRVLHAINEFLPVKEMAGQPIELAALKQLGLVDNEKLDQFLANAFAPEKVPARRSPRRTEKLKGAPKR